MSETYFHSLNLPERPIRNMDIVMGYEKWTTVGYHIWKHPRYYLNDPFLMALNRLGVSPGYIVFFCNNQAGTLDQRIIHSDLVSTRDPRLVKSPEEIEWRSCSFGINFEVTNSTNDFYWYELDSDVTPVAPPETSDPVEIYRAWLHGTHYRARDRMGVQPGARQIAETRITGQPTLVRADVPHSTAYTLPPDGSRRIGASIRFYENWTWEDAKEIFKSLIV